ncbi:hypothetical protein EIP91_007356 [Steccherinum ochraceum]|uniref:Uncharacterized protein n=1 Tax=Steccherinum ochraceum TaxID=92696 RepID=A0A4R0RZ12_9APHY|nr:hypothetical protein EIP91_007356 [Steccherinum ochraceum]
MSASTPNLQPFLLGRYPVVKSAYPGEGRRKWRLRVAEDFWVLSKEEKAQVLSFDVLIDEDNVPFESDEDPSDEVAGNDAPGLGLVVRTDFCNEDAWQYFVQKLQEGEAEFTSSSAGTDTDAMDEDPDPQPSSSTSAAAAPPSDNAEEDDEDEDEAGPIFGIVNPPADSPLRAHLTNASNLAVLRLLNDVSVRRTPTLPPDTKRHKPANRLIDHDGWQEVYEGKMVWVYDTRSNQDGCARVVSQKGGSYGTATADSWRARVSHICELQVNLASGAMSIDFGGLDRYDYDERLKNLQQAELPIV